jgi:hypothetical protein
MGDANWERARLFPVSGIGGADEQERRGASALLAVINAVREFGRAITVPLGAPAGRLSAFIEVPFTRGARFAPRRSWNRPTSPSVIPTRRGSWPS